MLPLPSASTLKFDSLFEYDQPSTDYRAVFSAKMRFFWLRHEQINTILMGSSRMMNGLDPSYLTDCVPYNMAYSGADLHSTIRQLQEYIIPHTPLLKTIVFSLDIDLLARAPQWFDLRIATSPGYRYDQNHEFWHKGFPSGFYSYLEQLPPTQLQESLSNFGYIVRDGSGWGAPDILPLGEWNSTPNAWKASLDSLSTLLQNLSAQSIQVVGVIFPQNPAFSNSLYLYGPDRSQTTDQIMSYIQTLQEKFPHFHVIDFHQNGQHDFGPEDASSEDHLSPQGAIKLTQRLNPMLKQFAP